MFFLAQTAVHPAGYRVRGVYGWVHPNDLNLLAGSYTWAGLLAELEREGCVTAQVASLPDAAEAAWLYRITQEGMNEIASAVGQKPPTVTPPGGPEEAGGVYVSEEARWALEGLRVAAGRWLSTESILEPCEQWNRSGGQPYRLVFHSHVRELVPAGLAEARTEAVEGKRAPPRTVYRATERGLAAPLLVWAGRHPDREWEFYSDYRQRLAPPLRCCFLHGSGN